MALSPTSIIRQSKFVKKSPHGMWNLILSTQAAESFHAKFLRCCHLGQSLWQPNQKRSSPFTSPLRGHRILCLFTGSNWVAHYFTATHHPKHSCVQAILLLWVKVLFVFFLNSFAFPSSNAGFKSNLIIVNKLSTQKAKKLPREKLPHRGDIHQDFVKARCNMMWVATLSMLL